MESHAQKMASDVANLQINLLNNFTKSKLHVLTSIMSKKKNWDLSRIVKRMRFNDLKCFYLARIYRPDILWSVNKFAHAITKKDESLRQKFSTFSLSDTLNE